MEKRKVEPNFLSASRESDFNFKVDLHYPIKALMFRHDVKSANSINLVPSPRKKRE